MKVGWGYLASFQTDELCPAIQFRWALCVGNFNFEWLYYFNGCSLYKLLRMFNSHYFEQGSYVPYIAIVGVTTNSKVHLPTRIE